MVNEGDSGLAGMVAVVGMAGRFPGAGDLGTFWRNLREGRDAVQRLSDDELRQAGVPEADLRDPAYVKARSFLPDYDRFDAGLFGFSPRDAEILDPQQRLLLEIAWETLEDAGYDPRRAEEILGGLVGVYAGATTSSYLIFHLLPQLAPGGRLAGSADPLSVLVANAGDSVATRISYKLNLKGPSFTVASACSTSLVAVHRASAALLDLEVDMALAGGASVNLSQRLGYRHTPDSILSPDGRCRTFDAEAAGSIFGSGVGMVALKRAEDALRDGDRIHALILGSAVNNDGSLKVGYTAPSVEGQAAVISEALAVAGVPAEHIDVVEAHGTGTRLGDPIEIQALTRAFGAETKKRRFAAIGSVKTNLGHLDVAAGAAGLIKTVLSMKHREMPPSLHYERPNPAIDFAASPVYVNAELRPWERRKGRPRRAGVSSFGLGGTNAHVVLQEAPEQAPVASSVGTGAWHLLPLSARTPEALAAAARRLAARLGREVGTLRLADVAYTLQRGRHAFPRRRMVAARTPAEAAEALLAAAEVEGESAEVVLSPSAAGAPSAELLELGRRWLAAGRPTGDPSGELGDEIDWTEDYWAAHHPSHQGDACSRIVSLPTYPFARDRFWVEALRPGSEAGAGSLADRAAAGGAGGEGAAVSPSSVSSSSSTASPGGPQGPAFSAGQPPGHVQTLHPRPALEVVYQAPRGGGEERLAALWQEILGVGPVGIYDNFFDLGGHSLLGTQLLARLQRDFAVELALADLFGAPTVGEMASLIEGALPSEAASPAPSTQSGPPQVEPVVPGAAASKAASTALGDDLLAAGRLPLSYAQRRLWFIDQLEPGNPIYNEPRAVRLRGRLDARRLASAIARVTARHEVLRTRFESVEGEPVQVVEPPGVLPTSMPRVDLTALPGGAREPEARRLARREAARSFDLARGPVSRARLLRLGDEEHLALFTIHHIASDGWSMAVLVQDLMAFYGAAEGAGEEVGEGGRPLPPLPVQYGDYALWQRRWLEAGELERQLAYWREALAGAPLVLDLPTDRPRPPTASPAGDMVPVTLGASRVAAVAALARRRGATPFMVLLGALQAVLYRWSGQEDLLVASAVANRRRPELEGLIGFFVNTLILRGRPGAGQAPSLPRGNGRPFGDFLDELRETVLGALAHQDLPFDKLVEGISPPRDRSRPPLAQVLFALQNVPSSLLKLPGLELEPVEVHSGMARYDFYLSLTETDGVMSGMLEYSTALYDRSTAERLAAHLDRMLEAVTVPEGMEADGMGRGIDAVPLLTAAERRELVTAANLTAAREEELASGELSVLGEIAARAEAHPRRAALGWRETGEGGEEEPHELSYSKLSYGELTAASRRLARRLRTLGVGPETAVALALPRSPEMVISLLAVLEAGGAYVPLDLAHPAGRLRGIVEDAAPAVLLTRSDLPAEQAERLKEILPPASGGKPGAPRLLYLDREAEALASYPAEPLPALLPPALRARTPAYVLFTSGSTGKPKGVEISRRSLANFLASMRERPGFGPDDSLLAVTTLSFDIAGLELLLPLVSGGRVELATAPEAADGLRLAARLRSSGATVMQATPATWQMLLDGGWEGPGGLRSFKALTGGEALPPDLARRLLAAVGPAGEVWNLYGPTETTVWSAVARVTPERVGEPGASVSPASVSPASVSLGGPIANTRLHVVDRRGEPVPYGIPGELLIGGMGLARGYRGRPGLTADRFRPDPFTAPPANDSEGAAGEPGDRLYRTGDLVRRRPAVDRRGDSIPGGTLEFLGRIDHQVKLRGFRIELGEIEAALAEHPAVCRAVVVALGAGGAGEADGSGVAERLAAYVVPEARVVPEAAVEPGGDEPLAHDLRRHVADRVPDYMVPASFTVLDAFPLTPSGKVDRRALPEPEAAPAGAGRPPETETERALAEIWSELLDRGEVSADDHFFELGGHSLLATRLAARISRRFRVELTVDVLFEAPVLGELAREVDRLLDRRGTDPAAKLEDWSGSAGGARSGASPGVGGRRGALSFAQQRLWFIDRLEPGSPLYNEPRALAVEGDLDPGRLARAFAAVVARHEALRTHFPEVDGEPVQKVVPFGEVDVSLPAVDLSALPPEAAGSEAERLTTVEARRPFDLARGPLFRTRLLRMPSGPLRGTGRHRILVTVHHVVSDGWSMQVLIEDVMAAYRDPEAAPEPLPLQYADYAAWQRRRLAGEEMERQLAYWREALAGAPQALDLPTDRPRPATASTAGARVPVALSPRRVEAVAALARDAGSTPFMVLLAAFQVLLYRLSGQGDLLVATPVANRGQPELEGLIGYFANTLVLRGRPGESAGAGGGRPGEPSFADHLAETRRSTLGALAHQELPFDRLVQALAPSRDRSRSPLAQVFFVLQNVPARLFRFAGLTLKEIEVEPGTARFDLLAHLTETVPKADLGTAAGTAAETAHGGEETRIEGYFEYAAALFDRATVRRFADAYLCLLDAAAARPGAATGDLPLLGAAERQQLLEANDTARAYPGGATVPALVAAQARIRPEGVAVVFREEHVSFRELAWRAGRVASGLRGRGIGRGDLVGVAAERSTELVAGLLGVMAAGAAYVPLDPDYPPERLAAMVEDAAMPLILLQEELADRGLFTDDGPVTLPLRALAEGGDDPAVAPRFASAHPSSAHPPSAHPAGDDLAYVIFTSGSTGRPKGAANAHSGVRNRLLWMQEAFALAPDDRVLQKTPFSFDVSVWEFFWPLLAGARLVMAEPGGHRDSAYLTRTLRERGITTLHFVPSMLGAFLDDPAVGDLPALKRVMASGEALTPELVDRFRRRVGPHPGPGRGARLHNLYGPTEAAVDVTHHPIPAGEGGPKPVPIGRPVANTAVHVVDRRGRPVPIGVAGELWIGGVQVGRGYVGRPALTARAFVPDPFAASYLPEPSVEADGGARAYRTGDLVRRLAGGAIPGGAIEFLGRIDHQVKIRGLRIELGEVEVALTAQPGVREARVLVLPGPTDEPDLVGYVTLDGASGGAPSPSELAAALARRLPAYMVPATLLVLDAFPLTPSGKVDVRALPDPRGEARRSAEHVPPRTPMESTLASLWSSLLGVEEVGARDHFFELGGHSLLATRMTSHLGRALGREVPVERVFRTPVLEDLAAALAVEEEEPGPLEEAPPALAETRVDARFGQPFPLSPAQRRLWFLDRLDPGAPLYNLPWASRLDGELSVRALEAALGDVVRRHEVLRTVFGESGESADAVQIVSPPAPEGERAPLPVVDLSALPEEARSGEARSLARREGQGPFDLTAGPVFRSRLLRLGPRLHVILFTLHHIAGDGWSVGVLVNDVAALYAAHLEDADPDLPPLEVGYLDYTLWREDWLNGSRRERLVSHWREHLAGAPPFLDLPTDRPHPPELPPDGDLLSFRLPGSLAEALTARAREEGGTLFMALLASLYAVLYRWTGQADMMLASPVAGRSEPELEGLVGFFVNTLVLRGRVRAEGGEGEGGELSFRSLLRQVRSTVLAGLVHQDLPFEELVEALDPPRDHARPPLAQVLFVLQNAPAGTRTMPGVTLGPWPVHAGIAKYELSLDVEETPGGLRCELEYSTPLFDRTTIRRLARYLERFAAAATADPEAAVGDLPLLAPAEAHQILHEWNDTAEHLPADADVRLLFARQAAERPGAVAAVEVVPAGDGWGSTAWTYAELAEAAGTFAGRLARRGVGRGDVVALLAERGLAFLAAVVGTWLAGAVYMPVDPRAPARRVRTLLAASRARLLVVGPSFADLARELAEEPAGEPGAGPAPALPDTADLSEMLGGPAPVGGPSGGGLPVVGPLPVEGGMDAAESLAALSWDEPAYVLFTSGSTGLPKGAVVGHRALGNHLRIKLSTLGLGAEDRVGQNASQAFDVSVWQMAAPLAAGGRVVIYPDEVARDAVRLVGAAREDGLTALEVVPSLMAVMVDELENRRRSGEALPALPRLRWLIPTGEALPPSLARRWLELYPEVPLVNAYGPAECADDVAQHTLRRPLAPWVPRVPVGRALPNLRLYLLDDQLRPVPFGSPGEICVAGTGVGLGYVGEPRRTAAVFVPDPFAEKGREGRRLYRTGDRGRALPGGEVEFIGRTDFQVKIRGMRIETSEIEAVLQSHPGVSQALVLALEASPGDRRLAAYWTPSGDGAPDEAGDLTAYLGDRLAPAMVPAALTRLDAFPLTPNGKVDRGALPAPDWSGLAEAAYVEPRTSAEELVADIWKEVLRVERVGALDDFFAVGGHSLLATQVMVRLRREVGLDLPLRELFTSPVLESFARVVEERLMEQIDQMSEEELAELL